MKKIHGGTWLIRYMEAKGQITKKEADEAIRQLRIKRKLKKKG